MKKLLSFLILISIFILNNNAKAQVFTEDFEGTVSMTAVPANGWGINTRVSSQGLKSDSGRVFLNGTNYLITTSSFSTVGKYAVYLDFDQICKIQWGDSAIIQISNDNGTTWQRVRQAQYLGTGQFGNLDDRFNETSYGMFWDPTGPSVPQQSWWKSESFDISALASNSPNVKIRFLVIDGNANGPVGRAGWFLDNIVVNASISEMIPPSVALISPIIEDTVFSDSPVDISASISDYSGIDTAICIVNVAPFGQVDTIGMVYDPTTVDTFHCQIPFYGFGRTTSYYIVAYDASFGHNADSTQVKSYMAKYTAGGTAIIGTGTSSSVYPFATYYHDARSQFIYTAAEISNAGAFAGTITSIAFDVSSVNSAAMNGFTIKMKNTSTSTLSGFQSSGFTTVYSPTSYTVTSTGWQTINLSTPFNWDGTSNLMIEICFDNTAYTSDSPVKASSAAGKSWARRVDGSSGCSLTGGSSQSTRPNIKIEITGSSDLINDLGVMNILNPTTGVIVGDTFEVKVDLKNFGVDTIRNGLINWTYDGTSQTPFILGATDSLMPSAVMAPIFLDSIIATLGSHKIVAWSEMPNGVVDYNIINDSAEYSFYGCASSLSGNYTIGGASADFNAFSDAMLALDQCGITGPVVFNVNDGVYNEQLLINNIIGLSSTNTVKFQSTNGDSSTVIVAYNANNANDNYVVKIDSLSYLSFQGITFEAQGSTFSRVFVLENDLHNLMINNCVIKTSLHATIDDDNSALIIGNVGNNINISNNVMSNASIGVKLNADVEGLSWLINNNIIHGQYAIAISLEKGKSIQVNNNDIKADTLSNANTYVGLYIDNNNGVASISKNKIYTTVSHIAYGIYFINCNFDSQDLATVSNNFVQLIVNSVSSSLTSGIINKTTSNVNVFYNTVNITGNSANSTAISLYDNAGGTAHNFNIINNIFANNAGGYIYYVVNIDTSLWVNDHNDLWNNNSSSGFAYLGGNVSDLAAWISVSGATNAISVNPYFVSSTDIHIVNNAMNGTATPIATITTDIDNDIRDLNNPDIGADEFNASPWDASVIEILSPMDGCGLSNEVVSVKIKNLGSVTINGNCTVSFRIAPSATAITENITDSIQPGDTLLYTFTNTANLDVYSTGSDSIFNMAVWVGLQNDPVANNDTSSIDINSSYAPLPPAVSDTTITYGSSVTLVPISPDSLVWFETDTSTIPIVNSNTYFTGVLFDTTTYWVGASAQGGGLFKLTETVQYKGATGATSPYPAYLPSVDFDGVEITNLGTATGDLSGFTINVNSGSSTYTYTFPVGTNVNSGDVVLAIYASGLTIGPAGNNVFNINSSTSISSSSYVTYWLTDAAGLVVDAFAANGATFPVGSPVVAADFSGTLMGGSSHPGAIRMISDNNMSSDWMVVYPTVASFGTMNASLSLSPTLGGCNSVLVPITVNISNIPQHDLSISQLISPQSGFSLTTSEPVKVKVKNYGSISKDTIPLAYQLNNLATVYDTVFQTLNSGDELVYTFGQTVNLSQFASFDFKVYTNLNYDTYTLNDTISTVLTNDPLIYCSSNATSTGDTRIDNITLENINNTSVSGCATYTDFTAQSTVISPGVSYQISATLGTCGGNYTKGAKAWIDYNNDGDFDDANEEIVYFGQTSPTATFTKSFIVPLTAASGMHRLRIVCREGAGTNGSNISPCGTYSYGETEDYTVIITPLVQYDAGIVDILNVADTTFEASTITPNAIIKNYGTDTISAFEVRYSYNNGTPIIYNYTNTLAPFQVDTVSLTPFTSPSGNVNLCVYTVYTLDNNSINDSSCTMYYAIPTKDAEMLVIQDIDEYCGMTYDTIRVRLTNIGIDTINGANQTTPTTISYKSNNLAPVVETFTPVVAPGDTVWYEFNSLIYVGSNNLMDSIYNIKSWITFVGDNVAYNDSVSTSVESKHIPSTPTVVSPVMVPYASPATLIANNSPVDTILWFADSASTISIYGGSPFITPWLNYVDTTLWVASQSGSLSALAVVGTGTNTNGTTSYPSPYANYYWGNKDQYLILASELTAMGISAGSIEELAFDVAAVNQCPVLQNYEIKMGSTTQNSLTAFISSTTTVYSNSGFQPTTGWNNHVFTTPYVWDGVSNLVIQVCSQNSSYVGSGNASVNRTSTSFTSVVNRHQDSQGVCNATTGSSSSLRPNMKILASGSGCRSFKTPVDINILPLSACDVGISDITEPISSVYMSSTETVKVIVENYGSSDQTNIPVNYQVDGGTVVTEYTSVPASSSIVYSFNTKADFSNMGHLYQVKSFTSLACDTTSLNNTYNETVLSMLPSYCNSSAIYSTYHDIENVTFAGINNTSPSPFDKTYTDYTNTPSAFISPGASIPITIKVNSASTYVGSGYIKVYIDYNKDGVFDPVSEKAVGIPFSGIGSNNPSNVYGNVSVPSTAQLGASRMRVVLVRNGSNSSVSPCGTYSYGETEDYSVAIANVIPNDAGVELITTPSSLSTGISVPVNAKIHNYGSNSISSVDISITNNNGTPTTITYSATTITPGHFVNVSLGNITLVDGMNNICAYTVLAGDSNTFNDKKCTTVFKEATVNLPYSDDFESSNLWMNDTLSNQWELGAPSMTNINSAYSPINVWAVNLSGNYNNSTMQYLYSPHFIITNNIDSALLKFWHFYDTETNDDGAFIQYRKNSGLWIGLGYVGDLRGTNWYTSLSGGMHKWTGNSGGWIQSTFNIDFSSIEFQNTDTLQMRYVFYSDAYTNSYDGWAIDNFELVLPLKPLDVGVANINNASTYQAGASINLSIDVKNYGTLAQTSIPVWYKLNNGAIVSETFTPTSGSLLPNAVETFVFTQAITAPGSDFTICSGTDLSNDAYPQNDGICKNFSVSAANIDGGVIGVSANTAWGGNDTISLYEQATVTAIIKNFGVNTLTSFDVEYSYNNGSSWTTETWTGNIAMGEVDTLVFATKYNTPLGNYAVCARTVVPNDAIAVNDMICKPFIGSSVKDANGLGFKVSQNEPNPANGDVRINYVVPNNADITFELRNTLGQIVYTSVQASFTGNNTIKLDANKLANGVYYYSVTFDGKRITRKMIVNQ